VLTSQNFGSYVTGVAFHPTKNLVASCSSDASVKLWNAHTGAELWTLNVGYYAPFSLDLVCGFQSDL
jgi:WD40 repeat protein